MKKVLFGIFCSIFLFASSALAGVNADTLDSLDSTAFVRRDDPKVIYVAKGGFGTYSTITGAINSLQSPNTTPTVIKVMPGKYTEFVSMKSHVNLVGSGEDVTTIESPSYSNYVITINSLTNVAISGFTISGGSYGSYGGIKISNSSPTISNNLITGHDSGIENINASATIKNNVIYNNHMGIYDVTSTSLIIRNQITNNNSSDVYVHLGTPHISYNIYNILSGTTGVGMYNLKSDGTEAPLP